jgi:hypothetical protein
MPAAQRERKNQGTCDAHIVPWTQVSCQGQAKENTGATAKKANDSF